MTIISKNINEMHSQELNNIHEYIFCEYSLNIFFLFAFVIVNEIQSPSGQFFFQNNVKLTYL